MKINTDKIIQALWRSCDNTDYVNYQDQNKMYVIIDAARDNTIYPKILEADVRKVCLFRGEKALELAFVAPYLVELNKENPFTRWLIKNGWGNSWMLFVESLADFKQLRNHFRSLIKVDDEEGNVFYFRYYDPRVAREFLPSCDHPQLSKLFEPIKHYLVEDKTGHCIIAYSMIDKNLSQNLIKLD